MEKARFAWNSGNQKWVWVKPSPFPPRQGKVWDGGNYADMSDQVKKVEALTDAKGHNGSLSAVKQNDNDDDPKASIKRSEF